MPDTGRWISDKNAFPFFFSLLYPVSRINIEQNPLQNLIDAAF
jgi:hypothetical protein